MKYGSDTAVSIITGTGLLTIPLSNFTIYGQSIVALFMQIGSLQLVTLTFLVMYLFFDLGREVELLAAGTLKIETRKHIKKIILFVVLFTIAIELLGAGSVLLPSVTLNQTYHSVFSDSNAQ